MKLTTLFSFDKISTLATVCPRLRHSSAYVDIRVSVKLQTISKYLTSKDNFILMERYLYVLWENIKNLKCIRNTIPCIFFFMLLNFKKAIQIILEINNINIFTFDFKIINTTYKELTSGYKYIIGN